MRTAPLRSWPPRRPRAAAVLAGCAVLLGGAGPATAASGKDSGTGAAIYSCVDSNGRRLSSDRPIPECLDQEQRVLGRDGTTRKVMPPMRSPAEQERLDAQRKDAAQAAAVRNEAVRRDRTLMARYPDVATHEAARQRALAPVLKHIESVKSRLGALEAERLSLTNERAALGFKAVPEELKLRTNINEGSIEAQRSILQNQETERDRINQQFDLERLRLQQLWRGTPPGSDELPAAVNPSASRP